eukprot:TRINITY_DN18116_c0_g1_i1.p4 TRINITY_DN18116_c0_g1~~TRINITY_DN18116_c0_g1_i1.p4  ORF type:complete len:104 (-),score=16.49 TRINITY_DN18116_c0_g1_i1:803-1114(-)
MATKRCCFELSKEKSDARKLRLYLSADKNVDMVDAKSYTKIAGICQSLLLEIADHALSARLGMKTTRAYPPVYQNVEYQAWKLASFAEEKKKHHLCWQYRKVS